MTSFDEALRALEKDWRERSHRFHGMGGQYVAELFADELSALLTTRQEVAPVADGAAMLVRDVCEMAPADPDAPDTVCIRVADLTRIAELYTTTGKTSDARDDRAIRSKAALLFFNKLRETSDVHEADASVGIFDASWHCGSSGLSDALNVALDAAMRQEVGNG